MADVVGDSRGSNDRSQEALAAPFRRLIGPSTSAASAAGFHVVGTHAGRRAIAGTHAGRRADRRRGAGVVRGTGIVRGAAFIAGAGRPTVPRPRKLSTEQAGEYVRGRYSLRRDLCNVVRYLFGGTPMLQLRRSDGRRESMKVGLRESSVERIHH